MTQLNCKIIGINWKYIAEIEDVSWPLKPLNFTKSDAQLIQMRNGMGKTTTILLLRHLFSGIPPDPNEHKSIFERATFAGGKKSSLGKKFDGKGEISISLDIDGQVWVIGLRLDYENFKAEFFHVHPAEGNRNGWDAPQNFRNLFQDNKEFTELFLIDTQEAGLHQSSLNKQIIDGSIKGVTPLRGLENLVSDLESAYDKKVKKVGADPGKEKLKGYQSALKKIKKMISDKKKDKTRLTNKRNQHLSKKTIAEKRMRALEAKSKHKDDLEKEKRKLEKAEGEQSAAVKELRESYLNPSNISKDIWEGIIRVYGELDELKLPEAVTKHVVEGIRKNYKCICGEEFKPGSEMDKHLMEFEKNCIDSDVQEAAISIKTQIIASVADNSVDDFLDIVKTKNKDIVKIESEIKRLKGLLPTSLSKQIQDLQDEIEQHKDDIRDINSKLKTLTSTDKSLIEDQNWAGKALLKDGTPSGDLSDYSNCKNISVLKRGVQHFTKLSDDVADIHYYNVANNQIISLIQKTIQKTLHELRSQIHESANKHFKPFQSHQMEISSLDDGVLFKDSTGNEKSGANTGAELAAQYSILLALTEIANCKIPLVIDNPVKGFDGGASEYFDENMTSLVNQLLLVIISGSQEREAIPTIVGKSESLSTIYRKNELVTGKDPSGKPPSGKVIITDDKEWFSNYNPPKKKKVK